MRNSVRISGFLGVKCINISHTGNRDSTLPSIESISNIFPGLYRKIIYCFYSRFIAYLVLLPIERKILE